MTLDGFLIAHGSAVILPLAVIEGPVVSVVAGFLAAQGFFDWRWAVGMLVAGDIAGDLILYAVGRSGGAPLAWLGRRLGLSGGLSPELQRDLAGHRTRMLLIGKWTHSIGALVLIGSGMLRLKLPGFIVVNLLATLPKTAVLFGLGAWAGEDWPLVQRHAVALLIGLGAAGGAGIVYLLRRAGPARMVR